MPRRKRKTKVVEPTPLPEPPVDPKYWLPKRLKAWVELRSKPKQVIRPKAPKKKVTRFQKKGPIDMKNFRKWYKKQMLKLQKVYEKTLELAYKVKYEKLKKMRRKKQQRERFIDWERLETLAIPQWYTPKFKIPLEENFPFSPRFDMKKPAKKEKGRPYIQKQIPRYFMHEKLEMDFWYEYRFPVSIAAMKCKASVRTQALAEPRKIPPDPHCPIPVRTEYIDPREKMSETRWRRHRKYLKFFALPKHKMYPRERPQLERGKKACISDLKDGIEKLSKPRRPIKICRKKEPKIKYLTRSARRARIRNASKRLAKIKERIEICPDKKDPYGVTKNAKNAKASSRTKELASPRRPNKLCPDKKERFQHAKKLCPVKENPFAVKRAALKACPSDRTKKLATPRKYCLDENDISKWPLRPCTEKDSKKQSRITKYCRDSEESTTKKGRRRKKKGKEKNKFSYTCKGREGFPCAPPVDSPL